MADIAENVVWSQSVRAITMKHFVMGGTGGIVNQQAYDIACRTQYLKGRLDVVESHVGSINDADPAQGATVDDKLQYLVDTRKAISDAIDARQVPVGNLKFDVYPDLLRTFPHREVYNVRNSDTFNPGTKTGGIHWEEPALARDAFDAVVITDLKNPSSNPVTIAPHTCYFTPTDGTHQYRIQLRIPIAGTTPQEWTMSAGVTLPETVYSTVRTALIAGAEVVPAYPNQIALAFDNYVGCASSAGFSVYEDGQAVPYDSVDFFKQADDGMTVVLRLHSKVCWGGAKYLVSYDGSGTLVQSDSHPVGTWDYFPVDNKAGYTRTVIDPGTAPWISKDYPDQLHIKFVRPVFGAAGSTYPVNVDVSKIMITGTPARAASVMSPSVLDVSDELVVKLSEPADDGTSVEPDIKVSLAAGGVFDEVNQAVTPFSDVPVVNNSRHIAITVVSASVANGTDSIVDVVMEGDVVINGGTSGTVCPDGWSVVFKGQTARKSIVGYTIAGSTIHLQLSGRVFGQDATYGGGDVFSVRYDGSDLTFKATANGDTIKEFTCPVDNHSKFVGVPAHTGQPLNLGAFVLGHNPSDAGELTQLFDAVHDTIQAGGWDHFLPGDRIVPDLSASYTFQVGSPGDDGYVFINSNPGSVIDSSFRFEFRVVGVDTWYNSAGNNNKFHHIALMVWRSLGTANSLGNVGHQICSGPSNAAGYHQIAAGTMAWYLENAVLAGFLAAGVPFDKDYMKAPYRTVTASGSGALSNTQSFNSKVFLPTEYEVRGINARSDSNNETAVNQGVFDMARDNDALVRRDQSDAACRWWLASPAMGTTGDFCAVDFNGAPASAPSNTRLGVFPVICVG